MAEFLSKELDAVKGPFVPVALDAANATNARVKRFRATFDLAAQASGSTLVLIDKLPKSFVFLAAMVTTSVTLGTATLSIDGVHTDEDGVEQVETGKYSTARAITSVETPVLLGKTTASKEREYDEKITATVGTAALPASGTLVIDVLCSSVA